MTKKEKHKLYTKKEVSLKKALYVLSKKNLEVDNEKSKTVLKTMKCGLGVLENKKQKGECLSEVERKILDTYIHTFIEKKQQILEDFYHYYQEKGIWDFLIHCAREKNTREKTFVKIEDKNLQPIELPSPIVKGNGEKVIIEPYYNPNHVDTSRDIYWYAQDEDTDDGCTMVRFEYVGKKEAMVDGKKKQVKIDLDNVKTGDFDPKLFKIRIDNQAFAGRISFYYLTGAQKNGKETAHSKKYKEDGVQIKGLLDDVDFTIREGLCAKVSAVITSFTAKLFESLENINKGFAEKDSILRSIFNNSEYKDKNREFEKYFLQFLEIKEDEKKDIAYLQALSINDHDLKKVSVDFNTLARIYNVEVNNAIQQYTAEKLSQAVEKNEKYNLEEEQKNLRQVYVIQNFKGIASFPQIKNLNKETVTSESLYEYAKMLLETYTDFSQFEELEINKKDFMYVKDTNSSESQEQDDYAERTLKKDQKWKYLRENQATSFILTLKKLFAKNRNNIPGKKLMGLLHYNIYELHERSQSKLVAQCVQKSFDALNKKKQHLEKLAKNVQDKSVMVNSADQKCKREFCDYIRCMVSAISWNLKKSGKIKEARILELEADEKLGLYKGTAFENLKKERSDILCLSGFDYDVKGTKKGVCFVFKNVKKICKKTQKEMVRTQWYLGLNLYSPIKFEHFENDYAHFSDVPANIYGVCAVKKSGKNDTGEVHILKLKESELDKNKKTLLIPLQLGKRQLREYFTNYDYPLIEGKSYPNSAEIIKTIENEGSRKEKIHYYASIVMSKVGIPRKELTAEKRNGIIAIDRGENTVAAIAMLDNFGNPFPKPLRKRGKNIFEHEVGASFSKVFGDEYRKSKEDQRRGSTSKLNVKNRIRNIIEQIAGDVVTYAIDHNLQIVMENLQTTFYRRGKGVYVAVAQQYNNFENFILSKLTQHNIAYTKGGILQKVPASYTSRMCSNCGKINSYSGKSDLRDIIIDLFSQGNYQKCISYKGGEVNLDQELFRKASATEKSAGIGKTGMVSDGSAYDILIKVFENKRIKNIELHVEKILKRVLYPRKNPNDAQDFSCNFCNFKCNADKQAAVNIGRFHLIPTRTESEKKKKMSSVEKLETEYEKRLASGEFTPGRDISEL